MMTETIDHNLYKIECSNFGEGKHGRSLKGDRLTRTRL